MVRRRLIIKGRVQGVFYRATTRDEATRLGLCGWVRNRIDGGVDVAVEGEAAAVDSLIAWCRKGPPHAEVTGIEVLEEEPQGTESSFVVRY